MKLDENTYLADHYYRVFTSNSKMLNSISDKKDNLERQLRLLEKRVAKNPSGAFGGAGASRIPSAR